MTDREQDFQLGLHTIDDEAYLKVWTESFLNGLEQEVKRWTLEMEHIEGRLAYYQKAQAEVRQQLAAAEQELLHIETVVQAMGSRSNAMQN